LTAFLVNDDDDRRAMSRLLDEVYGTDRHKPRIFTSRFIYHPHPVQPPRTSEAVLMEYVQVQGE
jgi:hypothetical protein